MGAAWTSHSACSYVVNALFMSDRNHAMNLKLNNDVKSLSSITEEARTEICIKEERRRTGRYIAILVGILLFILALYHAWVRQIPVVASLVVPALIMFVYVAWILYTASRSKRRFRLFDVEFGCGGHSSSPEAPESDIHISELPHNNIETRPPSPREGSILNSPQELPQTNTHWSEISSVLLKGDKNIKSGVDNNRMRLPIILVNDKPPEDLDQKWLNFVQASKNEKLQYFQTRRKFKRKYCRSRRHAAPKRSYSIG